MAGTTGTSGTTGTTGIGCLVNKSSIRCGDSIIKNISNLNGAIAFVPAFTENMITAKPNCVLNAAKTEAVCLEYPNYDQVNLKKTSNLYTAVLPKDPNDSLFTLNINPKITRDNLVFNNDKPYSADELLIQNQGDAPYCIIDTSLCSALKDGCEGLCISATDNSVLRRTYNQNDYSKI